MALVEHLVRLGQGLDQRLPRDVDRGVDARDGCPEGVLVPLLAPHGGGRVLAGFDQLIADGGSLGAKLVHDPAERLLLSGRGIEAPESFPEKRAAAKATAVSAAGPLTVRRRSPAVRILTEAPTRTVPARALVPVLAAPAAAVVAKGARPPAAAPAATTLAAASAAKYAQQPKQAHRSYQEPDHRPVSFLVRSRGPDTWVPPLESTSRIVRERTAAARAEEPGASV